MASPSPASPPNARARTWSIERRLAFGFALAASLIVGLAVISFWEVGRFARDNRWVEHTHRAIEEIDGIYSLLCEIESGQRGFTINGNEVQLQPYYASLCALPQRLLAIQEMIVDNPDQQNRLHTLRNSIGEKLIHSRLRIEQRRELGAGALDPKFFTGNRGKELMDAIRKDVGELISTERELLSRRARERDSSLHATVYSLGGLGALLSALLGTLYVAGSRELTERRRLSHELARARDQAVENARQKSEFLANMSHEIRTPLNGIVGMTGLLLNQPLDDEARDCAQTIDTCGEALLGVINDILDFSKIEAGKLAFEHIPFDLRETIDETVQILSRRTAEKGLELSTFIRTGVPAGLRGDPGRLRQVFLNLLGNALKFTDHGEITLHVMPLREHDGRVTLRFEVTDTGIGITPDVRGRLFKAFSQADGSTTRRYGGTGLGLAISRELVSHMGGEIGVDSTPGVGSAFWFTAVFDLDPARQESAAAQLPPADDARLGRLRVLIVDDTTTNRRILQHQLTTWGLFHASAGDGYRALAQLRLAAASGQPFHVVFLDMHMPSMDGLTLARAIKDDPDIAGVHLVLLTSVNLSAGELPATVRASLSKPVRARQLMETLRRIAFDLPPAPPPPSPPKQQQPLPSGRGPVRVLLAEDNLINRKVALRQLANLGCHGEAAANGREVLRLLRERGGNDNFDLVLMDVQMPEMDGFEATRLIRECEERARAEGLADGAGGNRQIIVAMTANAMDGDREKCLDAGMDDYLSKPVRQETLEAILRRWLPVPTPPAGASPQDDAMVTAFAGAAAPK